MGGPRPGTASRALTCTVSVLGVTLGQVLAKRSGCSEGWTAGCVVSAHHPPWRPHPTQALGTSKGGLRDHPQQALPSHLRTPRAGRSQFGDPWVPVHLGRTCRRDPGLLAIQPLPPSVCEGREVVQLAHRSLREGSRTEVGAGRRLRARCGDGGGGGGGAGPGSRPAALTALWPPPRTWPRSAAPSSGRRRRPWSRRRRIPRPQSAPRARRLRRGSRAAPKIGLGFGLRFGTRMAAPILPRAPPHRTALPGRGVALRPPRRQGRGGARRGRPRYVRPGVGPSTATAGRGRLRPP